MANGIEPSFIMFSTEHVIAVVLLCLCVYLLFLLKKKLSLRQVHLRLFERLFAGSLLIMEIFYHIWMVTTGRWNLSSSLPLELCSISLLVAILLLWTRDRRLYLFVFFAGIGGAMQAIGTPVLDAGFPHFRYFHFFYTHIGIIITALYFTWIIGYRPTFRGIMNTMIVLNVLLPFIFFVNQLFDANYMFLRMKPANESLLDLLGPYPWYILSLEAVALIIFVLLWLAFRKRKSTTNG
ncbi:TIGR02206 family membrane protein [Sporosarcina jiandibaonis]|uniref:YwaF family protein n=1 Tax=Sporosarcina jiandibaonis TaxID=2715535 RepID=UPI001557A626|nr:TIGR02206 family membrane protein [Sporosarcina jiandibaonis]